MSYTKSKYTTSLAALKILAVGIIGVHVMSACVPLVGAAAGGGTYMAAKKYDESQNANTARQLPGNIAPTTSYASRMAKQPTPPKPAPSRVVKALPKAGSDKDINSEITRRLLGGDLTKILTVHAVTDNGLVRLYGNVPHEIVAERAVAAAKAIPGVDRVESYLTVIEVEVKTPPELKGRAKISEVYKKPAAKRARKKPAAKAKKASLPPPLPPVTPPGYAPSPPPVMAVAPPWQKQTSPAVNLKAPERFIPRKPISSRVIPAAPLEAKRYMPSPPPPPAGFVPPPPPPVMAAPPIPPYPTAIPAQPQQPWEKDMQEEDRSHIKKIISDF